MAWLVTKYLLSAAIVVLVSEVAKASGRAGGLLAALPLVSLLALVWLHLDHQPPARIADQAWYTFWFVIPTLPMFLLFPFLQGRLGFWLALLAGAVLTLVCFVLFALLLRRFGILLW